MNTIAITAKQDFLQQLSSSTALRALSELIWNGFDAGSNSVEVSLQLNDLEGIEEIRIRDDGSGIFHGHVHDLFGNLGDSWKKQERRLNGRILHGKRGQGRFKAFALGNHVEWRTCCEHEGQCYRYQITGRANALDQFAFTDAEPVEGNDTGTEVVIRDVRGSFGALLAPTAPTELAKLFGVYLSQYPKLNLTYNGSPVSASLVQSRRSADSLEVGKLPGGQDAGVYLSVTEWKMPVKRGIFLCDSGGQLLHEVEVGPQVRAPGHQFTVHVNADLFRDLDQQGQLVLDELNPEVAAVLNPVRDWVKEHFRSQHEDEQTKRAEGWMEEGIHPFASEAPDAKNRMLFELLAGHLEDASPALRAADSATRGLTLHLLGSAIRHDPEALDQLVNELFPLGKNEQNQLAALLGGSA